jgi:glycyl-tRNA synthetase beta chain
MHQTLLVELFTEELPPKALKKLGDAFANSIADGLKNRGLIAGTSASTTFASPRRLAVSITNVLAIAPDQAFTEKLMPVAVGLDKDGKATPALLKKLAAKSLANIDVATLERENDGKADQLIYRGTAAGQSLQQGLQAALEEAIKNLPVPKVMSYQLTDGATTVQFVRPAHALMALHGANVVPVTALGLTAGRTTHGHRFQGAVNIELMHADEYEARLEEEGSVVASFEKRKKDIESQLRETAELHGANLGPTDDYAALLDEVTALVERPTVYVGAFETEFLSVPAECLILTMKLNQKYFPLFNRAGKLSNQFLIVSNMRLDNPHNIIEGNQRVVRPRLSDARFFFETDKKTKLTDRVEKLANVTYQTNLGSQFLRTQRIALLAWHLATHFSVGSDLGEHAAKLAKADLLTDMVGEFPELQGVMGKYYALAGGETLEVALSIEEHYLPRFAGDKLPTSKLGALVSLSDRMISLGGLFYAGFAPTGDKDQFGLRRAALGALRILLGGQIDLSISKLIDETVNVLESKAPINAENELRFKLQRLNKSGLMASPFGTSPLIVTPSLKEKLTEFMYERLSGILVDVGYSRAQVDSVLADRQSSFKTLLARLDAVMEFVKLPEAAALAAANKRISNILKKSNEYSEKVEPSLFDNDAEKALFEKMQSTFIYSRRALQAGHFSRSLSCLSELRESVDTFFDCVMVNVNDPKVQSNRLGLLATLHREMNQVADLSKLAA